MRTGEGSQAVVRELMAQAFKGPLAEKASEQLIELYVCARC